MVDLVGTRVKLRRAEATRYEGLCPLNDERTPSFGINPADKLFHCFGCGEGGDARMEPVQFHFRKCPFPTSARSRARIESRSVRTPRRILGAVFRAVSE